MQLQFGERNLVQFNNASDFYVCLGFLLNPQRGIRFDWEEYNNKWGIEGRIWIKDSQNAPASLRKSFSAGTNSIDNRLNCNEYVKYLQDNYGIVKGKNQNIKSIQSKIPPQYCNDFVRGFKL